MKVPVLKMLNLKRIGVFALASIILVMMAVLTATTFAGETSELRFRSIDKTRFPKVGLTMFVSHPQMLDKTLTADDVIIKENGKTQDVLKVDTVGNKPMTVVMAIDTSGSMTGQPIANAKAAAKEFVQSMKPNHQLAVVSFNTTPAVVVLPTSDKNVLNASIDGLDASSGDTALYDGLVASLDICAKAGESQKNVIVLSDGADNKSNQTLDNVVKRAKDQGVAVFGVGLVSPDYNTTAIDRITAESGGKLITTSDPQTLSNLYRSLAKELNQQYMISYMSNTGPQSKKLAIKVTAIIGLAQLTKEEIIANPGFDPDAAAAVRSSGKEIRNTWLSKIATSSFWYLTMLLLLFISFLAFTAAVFSAIFKSRNPVMRALTPYEQANGGNSGSHKKYSRRDVISKTSPDDDRKMLQEAIKMTNMLAEKRGLIDTIRILLIQSEIPLKPAEFIFFHLFAVVGIALIAQFAIRNILVTAVLVVMATALPLIYMYEVGNRRKRAFHEQLPDLLMMMAGSLKAGYGLLQAFRVASEEMEPPASNELKKVLAETNLGLPVDEALDSMAGRLNSETVTWVVTAIKIHLEIGGNLAEILESIAATVRERDRISRQIEVLTAEGRLSAIILLVLPIILGIIMSVLNPSYISQLFTTKVGLVMITVASALMLIGAVWLKQIVTIEV